MSSDRLEALMNQAEALVQARRYEEAFSRFEEALQINPSDMDCLKAFSKSLLGLRQYERAASTFEKILQVDPACTSILHSYKSTLFKLSKGSQANKIFDQALEFVIKQDLASSNVLLAYINLFMSIGNYLKVAEIFEYSFENHPKTLKLLLAYVKFLIKEGRIKEAIQVIDPLLDGGYVEEYEQELYQSLSHLEKHEQSYKIFDKLLEKYPSNVVILRCYIKSLINSKQHTKAFNVLISVFQVNSESLKLLDIYIQKMRESNQYDLMLSLCEKIHLDNTPNSRIISYHLCKSLSRRPAYIQSVIKIMNSFFELAVEEKIEFEILNYWQGDPKPLLMRIEVLMNNLNIDKALRISKFMSECEPHSTAILTSYAKDLVLSGNHKEAYATFERLLQIEPSNSKILIRYASALVSAGQHEKALQLFEQALEIEPDSPITLSRYAATLNSTGQAEKALQYFERSLKLKPDAPITLSRYANFLASRRQYEVALQFFERSLQIQPNDAITLSRYANTLASTGQHEKALQFFERSLQIQPTHDVITLTNYARSLFKTGHHEKALEIFENALTLSPDDIVTLSNYGKALSDLGDYQKAINIFEQSLKLQNDNIITLTYYAETLTRQKKHDDAFRIFEKCLKINPNDVITLSRYISALLIAERYRKAVEISKHLLSIEPNNTTTLIDYGKALVGAGSTLQGLEVYQKLMLLEPNNAYILGQYGILLANLNNYEKACSVFSHCLQIRPDSYISFQYARALEEVGKYQEAIDQLESINIDWLTSYQANVIRVNLGRLYYRMKQLEKGNEYFEAAIAHSNDKERTLLYSARSILASNPYSETAIEMLQRIAEDSPRYAQALEMLTLNLNEEDYFEMVKTDIQGGLSDTEILNRAMYHKIANEISILKGIAYRILRRSEQEDPLLSGIIQDIEEVFSEVDRRRVAQKSEIETISHDDYDSILAVISKTAHDISDFVNNQLAVIESKTRRAMQKLQTGDTHYPQFEKLLTQLELTQTALNDLKAINEGIRIKYRRFKVRKLFEKWESEPQIAQAQVVLDIQNANSEFNGDEEKIKSALNELVENSLKHNSSQKNLTIRITSQDVMNPPGIWGRTIPGEQKYLFIEFTDNGNGVPGAKKDWIFQPLKTTSQEDKGSGLGLFIIRRTLTKMNGYIRETGSNGARFEIYIPYSKVEA